MRTLAWLTACVLGALSVSAQPPAAQVTDPAAYLGRPLGADFTLADWTEVGGYYRKLDAESPRVRTEVVGTTTEGRDFLISIISSEANLGDLPRIKDRARVLADPRGRTRAELDDAGANGKVILFVACAMHSTETAAPQFGMEFAHVLATSDEEPWRSARERMVVVMIPCANPDGLDLVVNWYRRHVGTPLEDSDLPRLYQLYAGHDNNRDWFALTQAETRIVTRLLYKEWFPTAYWDVHQQGTERERLFVPPFRDPLNPNLDPVIIGGINLIGTRAVLDMTSKGFTGVATGVTYDMWWNGGNRNVPVRHNIVGLLTEAASVNIASPIYFEPGRLKGPNGLGGDIPSNQFLRPWPGGWWRIRDIIDYEMAFGESLLGTLSREPGVWLDGTRSAATRAVEAGAAGPSRAWIIPSDNRDPVAVAILADVLMQSGVEMSVLESATQADGREYPAGSLLIRADQPYGLYVRDLFDVQRYPGDQPPYDVAGWTLPLLMGVRRVEVVGDPPAAGRAVLTAEHATSAFKGDARASGGVISTLHSDAWTRLARALAEGGAYSIRAGGGEAGLLVPEASGKVRGLPRIGLYAPWSGSMDEGWMRYVLDADQIPYVRVRNEMIRAGDLRSFIDVLIVPSIGPGTLDDGRRAGSAPPALTGGLAPEGAIAIEEFVREGGTLITLGSASRWAIDLFRSPLVDVTVADKDFSCPGSVLRATPESGDLTAGLPPSVSLFFSKGAAYREMTSDERKAAGIPEPAPAEKPQVLLRYAPSRLLQSGWIAKPEVIAGQAAWVRVPYGKGRVHVFGFQPQYRGWSRGTFQLVHRAALLDAGWR
ncbi:MAG: M14 metallopeptidase family protein [Phycisphaerales bacterium]